MLETRRNVTVRGLTTIVNPDRNFSNFMKLAIICIVSGCAFADEFPAGFPSSAWGEIQTAERAAYERAATSLPEAKPDFQFDFVRCAENTQEPAWNDVKYILNFRSSEDHHLYESAVHLLDAQGHSVLRLPPRLEDLDGGQPPRFQQLNYSSCLPFSTNGSRKCLAMRGQRSNKLGAGSGPDDYVFLIWPSVGSPTLAFEYRESGNVQWVDAMSISHPAVMRWRSKMVFKDMDGVSGKEIVIRRLVLVLDAQTDAVRDKYLEDVVLAWNTGASNFRNITNSLSGDVHQRIKDAISSADLKDVYLADGPGINYEPRPDFENLDIPIKTAAGDLPVEPQ